jgi:hypothetical protein
MKANDLRIGNWVQYDGTFYQIESLTKVDAVVRREGTFDFGNRSIEKAQPIELTEEVLLKIGFKKDERMSSILYYLDYEINEDEDEYIRVRYVIYNLNTLPLLRITSPTPIILESCELTKRGIRYLHQLQNAYHLLTGQELEVNL